MLLGRSAIIQQLVERNWRLYIDGQEQDLSFGRDLPQYLSIGPHSMDLTLGPNLLVPSVRCPPLLDDRPLLDGRGCIGVDPLRENRQSYERVQLPTLLAPRACALAAVRERLECRNPIEIGGRLRYFTTKVDGRSTVGRLFLMVHVTAGYGDYGFSGCYTLELVNLSHFPIKLHPGMRVAQMSFEEVYQPDLYDGGYGPSGAPQLDGQPQPPITGPGRF